jgi:3-oxoacyl-[acyl-carrier protein] reductase
MALPGLQGKTVVVTGGGQGIGRAYARRFGQEGCRVVIAEMNAERGEAAAEEVREDGGEALFVHCDVGDSASCTAMAQAAQTRFGRIDGLVNNAAIFSTIQMKPFWEIEEADWDRLLTVNVKGPWLCSRAVLPAMRAAGGGSIVNISSGAYWLARPGYAHYITSKAAILGLTRAMARELGDAHIRVNAITPGPIYTEVPRETVTPAQQQAMLEAQCLKRLPGPDDLVGTVAFLISDDSGWITGQTINVDGGLAFP